MFSPNKTLHGGEARKGRRKIARPLATDGRFMHVVFRSSKAVGKNSFQHGDNPRKICLILDRVQEETKVEVRKFRNVGNHFHLLVRSNDARLLRLFLKLFPQKVALLISGAKKGAAKGKFFDHTAFTRVVDWGRDYANVIRYLIKNSFEELGYSSKEVKELFQILCTHPINRMHYLADMNYRGQTLPSPFWE